MSTITPDNMPDDYWGKIMWHKIYSKRSDLEIQLYKDIETICRRITRHETVCLLLELPERKQREGIKDILDVNDIDENCFYIHIEDQAEYHKIEMSMTECRHGYYSLETENYPVYKVRVFSKYSKDFSLLNKLDYLSARAGASDSLGDYETQLIYKMNGLLQPGENKYLLDSINVNMYIQATSNAAVSDIPTRLLPVDIRAYSIYAELVSRLLTAAAKKDFDGFHCEYMISGTDRRSLILFIEDKEDRWDGLRYQACFRISLYQMPGSFRDSTEGRLIRRNDGSENLYALDTIIVNGDKCDSLDHFSITLGGLPR